MFESDNYKTDTRNYKVGMYLRLSKEDENTEQSESIINQKEYITRYILDRGWDLYEEYVDDGYTGTNFDRPAFQRMLEDIENEKINMVIVKDSSRLGRDYIGTGHYIEKYFPSKNVRFIAINDNIDTFNENNGNNQLTGFKGVINDMYSADISRKIRSTFNAKRQNGQFIGAFAPYGYIKDPHNKNKLIIDPEASLVVKRIFNMRVKGIGTEEIMRTLNNEKIPCPTVYKKQKGSNYKNVNIVHNVWRAETIKWILTNPTYIGNIAQRKSKRVSYKVRKHKKLPKNEWIIVENTHEPIVDKETFETVQELLQQKAYGKTINKTEHLLGGMLVCGDCGMSITFRREKRKGKKEFITLCSNYSRFHHCNRHAILEKEINKLVINDLKAISKKAIKNKNKFLDTIKKPTLKIDNTIQEVIKQKESRKQKILDLRKSLYEDWKKGNITKDDFDSMYEDYNKEKEQLNSEINSLQNQKSSLEQENKNSNEFYNMLEQITSFKVVPKEILIKLIDKVEIFQDKTVKIHYKFSRP